jgi:omega-6 fatty acid desaturase (delta-12 desaturase)
MRISANGAAAQDDRQLARHLARHCASYKGADLGRSLTQLLTTAVPFMLLSTAMWFALENGYWFALALTLPAAGLLLRFFIIQHDCGHGSFFRSRFACDMLGRAISLLTLTPYGNWRKAHAIHHATSGNLAKRGFGDIKTLTVREYQALGRGKRWFYRLYRNPLVLLFFGPPYLFILSYRVPFDAPVPFREAWPGVVMLNAALVVLYGSLGMTLGWLNLLLILGPIVLMSAWAGGWLFFIQHQFENTVWDDGDDWDFHDAAIRGSSYYVLPKILQWFTGNIGLHHIHHLNGKIPNYRLQECLDASPELKGMSRLTILESLKCPRLALWDEDSRRLTTFRQAAAAI